MAAGAVSEDRTPDVDFGWDVHETPLGQVLGEAVGYASMLWSETPKGVFDDVHAGDLVNELLRFLTHRDTLIADAALGVADRIDREDRAVFDQHGDSPSDLRDAIASVLNQHSQENESNTPDFLLAEYMLDALRAFERVVNMREAWYGRPRFETSVPADPPSAE